MRSERETEGRTPDARRSHKTEDQAPSMRTTDHTNHQRRLRPRPREARDLPATVAALAAVHAADHYPLTWPADPAGWLNPTNLLAAWVADDEERLLGHVALCVPEAGGVADLWLATAGTPLEGLAEVAKLFVAPRGRGLGLGAALLARATEEAHARGLRPVLEVLDHDHAARALYERIGWCHVGTLPATWATADGARPLLHAYLGPTT